MAKPSVREIERVKKIGRYLAGKPRAKRWFRWQQSGGLEACSDADWEGDEATRRSMSAGVIKRGGHRLKVGTKKQQVVSLSSAESDLYAAVKNCIRRLGIHGDVVWTESTSGRLSNDVLGPQRTGQGETRHPSQVGSSRRSRHERENSRRTDETNAEIENRAAHEHHGSRVRENQDKRVEVSIDEKMMTFQITVFAVRCVRWIGGIRAPVTNSLKCEFCKRKEFVCASGCGRCRC